MILQKCGARLPGRRGRRTLHDNIALITHSQFFADGNISVDLTDEQRKMLEEWNSLTPEQKKVVHQLMKTM